MTSTRLWATAGSAAILAVATIFLTVSGCGKPKPTPPQIVEVEGTIFLDNEPLRKVRVRFIPAGEYATEYTAFGDSDDTGHFSLTCHGQPGACVGDNTVIIEESELPAHLKGEKGRLDKIKYYESLGGRPLPSRYSSLSDVNPLIVTVSPDRKVYPLNLTR
jgi:hypothetical protein